MANVLKIKRSSVAGKLPLTTDLQLGELAINTTDGRLFTKKNVSATDYIVEFLSTDSAFKTNAVVATTANITLSATQTIDGVVVAVGDRVLVKDQSSAAQNGVYIVAAGAWTRAPDMDTAAKCAGAKVSVNSGTTNGGRCFDTDFKSTDTLGTTSMTWARALDVGAIGVDVQAYDADLSAIAGLAGTSGFLKKTAANTWSLDTATYASISSSNVFTANQDFGNGTGAVYLDLNGAAGSDRALVLKTAGVTRWTFNANTSAESGSNAGSNFELYRHTDAGAYIDTVMSCNRATGITNFKELSLGTDLAVQYGGTGVSTLTGIVKGNGTSAFSAAVAGTDYVIPSGTVANATQLATARNINGVGFNGTADILVPSIYDSNYRRITNPGGAEYVSQVSSVTGALQITLPVGYTNTMMRMTIRVFNYASNQSFDVVCGGYNYATSPSWVNTFAYILGNPDTDRRFTVRFGYTAGGKCCVYIGELASSWVYPQFYVTDVQLGYSGMSSSFVTGWATSVQASAFENVTSTISACQVGYATSTNVVGAVVLRDGSGNFSINNITGASTYMSNWFRSTGDTGWYSENYGGGIWMNNSTQVKVYGSKQFWCGPFAGTVAASTDTSQLQVQNGGGTGDNDVACISFHCSGAFGTKLHLRSDGYFGVGGWSASTWRWYVATGTGDMTAAGNVVAYSDERLKENVAPLKGSLEKIKRLNGVSFNWKNIPDVVGSPGKADLGVLAHEVEAVAPEVMGSSPHKAPEGDNYKTVAYDKLIPILIEAIKELSARVEELERK